MTTRKRPQLYVESPLAVNAPLTEARILLAASWVKDTTLLYGGSISTAFTVAGVFAKGLEDEMRKRDESGPPADRGPRGEE